MLDYGPTVGRRWGIVEDGEKVAKSENSLFINKRSF